MLPDKLYKSIQLEEKGFNDAEMSLIALISTPDLDRQGEAILTNAWDFKNYQTNPVVLLSHDYSMPPVGRAMWVKKTAEGIKAKLGFAPTQLGEELYKLYKEGFMNAFSVGFKPKEAVHGKEASDLVKDAETVYTKAELLEFSAVSVPANQNAVALRGLDIKSECLIKMLNIKEDDSARITREAAEAKAQADTKAAADAKAETDRQAQKAA